MSDTISIDDLRGVSSFIPAGRYTCRLVAASGTTSKSSGKPMVTAIWEIQSGPNEGMEITDYYTMAISEPKKPGQKKFSAGLVKFRDDAKTVGDPLPTGFGFPYRTNADGTQEGDEQKVARLISKHLGNKNVEILMHQVPRKDKTTKEVMKDDEGNTLYDVRPRILGRVGGPATPTSATEALL